LLERKTLFLNLLREKVEVPLECFSELIKQPGVLEAGTEEQEERGRNEKGIS